MVDLLGGHRLNDGDVVREFGNVRELFADFLSALSVFIEFESWAVASQWLSLQLSDRLSLGELFGHWLAVHLRQFGFVVERFQLRRSAGHTQKDDSFRFRRKMRFDISTES